MQLLVLDVSEIVKNKYKSILKAPFLCKSLHYFISNKMIRFSLSKDQVGIQVMHLIRQVKYSSTIYLNTIAFFPELGNI